MQNFSLYNCFLFVSGTKGETGSTGPIGPTGPRGNVEQPVVCFKCYSKPVLLCSKEEICARRQCDSHVLSHVYLLV